MITRRCHNPRLPYALCCPKVSKMLIWISLGVNIFVSVSIDLLGCRGITGHWLPVGESPVPRTIGPAVFPLHDRNRVRRAAERTLANPCLRGGLLNVHGGLHPSFEELA